MELRAKIERILFEELNEEDNRPFTIVAITDRVMEEVKELDELKKKLEIATGAFDRIVNDFECAPQSVAKDALNKTKSI